MYCWRRLEEIVKTNLVKNYVLYRIKKKDNILNTIKKKTGQIDLSSLICHLTAF